ncbi:MAG: polymer-forming cytoskeletal protein [Phycisphaerae bacterium]|nr:polymer-forming cytoskeletal protein [Phycisphaerae bacterium]
MPQSHPSNEQMTIISPDTQIKGEMTFERSVRILGTFEGKIFAKGELEVGESGTCRATVDASVVRIEGALDGDLIARDRAELASTARVTGDIVARTLIVAEGASFSGHCRVGPEALTARTAEPRATAEIGRAPRADWASSTIGTAAAATPASPSTPARPDWLRTAKLTSTAAAASSATPSTPALPTPEITVSGAKTYEPLAS